MRAAFRATATARALLAIAASIVALGLCEAIARLVVPWPPPSMIRFQELHVVADGAGIGGQVDTIFESDSEVFWRLRPNTDLPRTDSPLFGTIANAQGLRETRSIPLPKPERQLRILFLGDSTTFGWGLAPDQTQARATERRLLARFPGVDLLTVNLGVPGYTALQGLRVLATRAAQYEPDLIVASFGFNDAASWGGRGDLELYEHLQRSQPSEFWSRSRLARLLWSALHPPPPVGEPGRVRLTRDDFRGVLEDMGRETERLGADLLILVGAERLNVDGSKPPSHRSVYQQEQLRVGETRRFGPRREPAVVDSVPALQALAATHDTREIFLDRVHPTALANETVGELLAEKIAAWLQTRIRY